MAIQILPPKDDWGSQLGRILGTGLGAGLERYGTAKGLQALGIPQQQSVGMSALDPRVLGQALKPLMENLQGQANLKAMGLISSGDGQQQQGQQIAPQQDAQASQQQVLQNLSNKFGTQIDQGRAAQLIATGGNSAKMTDLIKTFRADDLKQRELDIQEEKELYGREFKDVEEEVRKKGESASTRLPMIDQQLAMIDSGMGGPTMWQSLLKFRGYSDDDIAKLSGTKQQQLYVNEAKGYMRDAKPLFGAKLNREEILGLQEMFGSIMNHPEVNKSILQFRRIEAQEEMAKKDVLSQIKGAYGWKASPAKERAREKAFRAIENQARKDKQVSTDNFIKTVKPMIRQKKVEKNSVASGAMVL